MSLINFLLYLRLNTQKDISFERNFSLYFLLKHINEWVVYRLLNLCCETSSGLTSNAFRVSFQFFELLRQWWLIAFRRCHAMSWRKKNSKKIPLKIQSAEKIGGQKNSKENTFLFQALKKHSAKYKIWVQKKFLYKIWV